MTTRERLTAVGIWLGLIIAIVSGTCLRDEAAERGQHNQIIRVIERLERAILPAAE